MPVETRLWILHRNEGVPPFPHRVQRGETRALIVRAEDEVEARAIASLETEGDEDPGIWESTAWVSCRRLRDHGKKGAILAVVDEE